MNTVRALFVGVAAISLLTIGPAANAQDKTIKIGALFPMSGPGSYFGAQDKQGVELALEQLNKSGVNGYKFAVQYEDSSCGPLPRICGTAWRSNRATPGGGSRHSSTRCAITASGTPFSVHSDAGRSAIQPIGSQRSTETRSRLVLSTSM